MTDKSTTDDVSKTPQESAHIWWVYVVIIAALLVPVFIKRMSPFGWFPVSYGVVFGLIVVFLPSLLRIDLGRIEIGTGRDWQLLLIAALGASAAILLAADRYARREPPALSGAAAELIRQFEAMSPGIVGPTLKPKSSGMARYFTARYRSEEIIVQVAGVMLESVLAAGACWAAVRIARWKFAGVASEAAP